MKRIKVRSLLLMGALMCSASISVSAEDAKTLSYDGYQLKWQDDFNGTSLDRNSWNVELHQKGWVNNELQQYVDSNENIVVKDGKLYLKPVTKNKANNDYTSGRVNTQNKHDFTYGLFECYAKVPKGKGFLPAFWMMPTDESRYGQWPRCGEIDIMEVVGSDTNKCYGTVHYGSPHAESQGSLTLKDDSFSSQFHLFSCEWEPGKLTWYVDGKKIHTENDWYTKIEGQDEKPYPAPFNQPFYMILNLAVGGNWPGSPDKDANYIDNSAFVIDYVRVYQKASYNENVTKPKKVLNLKAADTSGNFVTNGNFKTDEDLTDEKDWIFLTAQGGKGSAKIEKGQIHIMTQNSGIEDYGIQLVQPSMPLIKNTKYVLTFKAYASKQRTMKVAVTAPKRSWKRYLNDTSLTLTEKPQTYSFEFVMKDSDDDSGRVEFNMGKNASTADIFITDVCLKEAGKIEKKASTYDETKDTALIKNGAFDGELSGFDVYIDSSAKASCEISSEKNNNAACFTIDDTGDQGWKIQLMQKKVKLEKGKTYILRFKVRSDIDRKIMFAMQRDGATDNDWNNYGTETVVQVGNKYQVVEKKFTMPVDNPATILSISIGAVGNTQITKTHHVYIDDVTLEVAK